MNRDQAKITAGVITILVMLAVLWWCAGCGADMQAQVDVATGANLVRVEVGIQPRHAYFPTSGPALNPER